MAAFAAAVEAEVTRIRDEYAARLTGPWHDIQDQMVMLYHRAASYPNPVIREFGVRTGNSTCAFLAAVDAVGGSLESFDIVRPDVPGWWADLGWVCRLENSKHAEVGPCDIVFIDTTHLYEDTLTELRRLVPQVRPGGLVLLHDTKFSHPGGGQLPVARALDTFCAETGLEWSECGGFYGLGEIRK